MNYRCLENGTKGMQIFKARDLSESVCNQASFIYFNGAVRVKLGIKDPFRAHDIGSRWSRN